MKLKSIKLSGYKSISSNNTVLIELNDINVLLGANGVGKSNLISFFTMLNYMMTGSLQNYIALYGFADSFLYFGSKQTHKITAEITFADEKAEDKYKFVLSRAIGDTLIFTEESLIWTKINSPKPYTIQLEPGVKESDLLRLAKSTKSKDADTATIVYNLLRNCKVFHFHDTSINAKIRGQGYIQANQYLLSDASNLAAFLYRLKNDAKMLPYYTKIVRYIQNVMPQFADFELYPNTENEKYITLNWRAKQNLEHLFGAHQISDGSLRFMCLAALLLQPKEMLPNVIILDEPELGLHPTAIIHLASMIKAVSHHSQIILATQSQRLVDEFELNQIIIAELDKQLNSTVFIRKDTDLLSTWLEEYNIGELWEKNVIGGQP